MKPLPEYVREFIVKPESVYKFYRIDENFKNGLKNSYFWLSSPSDFNDPFDTNPDLVGIEPNEQYIRDFFHRHKSDDNVNRRERRKVMHNAIKDKMIVKNALRDTLKEGFAKRGICCFSTYNTSILMWSHYSDKHRGVCLQFDPSPFPEEFVFLKVRYTIEFEKIPYEIDPERALLIAQSTKFIDWKYEDELRILMDQNGKLPFPKNALKEITFGCNCSVEDQDDIKKIVKDCGYTVSFKRARKTPNKFQIEFK